MEPVFKTLGIQLFFAIEQRRALHELFPSSETIGSWKRFHETALHLTLFTTTELKEFERKSVLRGVRKRLRDGYGFRNMAVEAGTLRITHSRIFILCDLCPNVHNLKEDMRSVLQAEIGDEKIFDADPAHISLGNREAKSGVRPKDRELLLRCSLTLRPISIRIMSRFEREQRPFTSVELEHQLMVRS